MLALPPLIPLIHLDIPLSQTEVGVLSALPPLLLGSMAVSGAWLVSRVGARRTLLLGMMGVALGAAARGAVLDIRWLYLTTAVMCAGIAAMHTALPQVSREWAPRHIALATAVYSNGLLVGEALPVAITTSIILPLTIGDWRAALSIWGIPVFVTTILVTVFSPSIAQAAAGDSKRAGSYWAPDWNDPLVRWGGILVGGVGSMYFGAHAFFPDHFSRMGRGEMITPSLIAINVAQIPASLLMLLVTSRLARRFSTYAICAAACLIGLLGMMVADGEYAVVLWSAIFGFFSTIAAIATYAMLYMFCRPQDTYRIAAGVMVIGYGGTVITPVLGGAVWDITGLPWFGLLPALAWPVLMILAAAKVGLRR